MKRNLCFVFIVSVLGLSSCRKTESIVDNPPSPQPDRGVFITNEGAFPNAGTISYYNITKDTVLQEVIHAAAGWITPNDARVIGKKLYIVVNGNDKIEVLDADTFVHRATITFPAGSSPGFIDVQDTSKAYVANYNGTVSCVDLRRDSVVATSVQVVGFPGGIVTTSGKIFVLDTGLYPDFRNIMKVLDATTLAVLDSIRVGVALGTIVKGAAGTLYIVSNGGFIQNGKVYEYNIATNSLTDSVEVGIGPSDIVRMNQTLYVLHGDRVVKLTTMPLSVSDSAFVRLANGVFFYALNVDSVTGDVYISKVISGGGTGQVEIYTSAGTLKRQPFNVGTFPGAFAFK